MQGVQAGAARARPRTGGPRDRRPALLRDRGPRPPGGGTEDRPGSTWGRCFRSPNARWSKVRRTSFADFLSTELREELKDRLEVTRRLAAHRGLSVEDARRYVEAMLGFEVYSRHLFEFMLSTDHHEALGHG